ncbi:hypothetical protein COLSTE_02023 [Collinsella stercoris DSM 13279]|uniref:Uncharacterized protein n=1 Tax=Collinsella stercoris DSM 13279 TaxID=445975 RepID=B6GD45_9ACTN|nr:hypothetical protein COLSTE_02023 [Collinsella stercoris DSM 13279]
MTLVEIHHGITAAIVPSKGFIAGDFRSDAGCQKALYTHLSWCFDAWARSDGLRVIRWFSMRERLVSWLEWAAG